ncbi:putative 3-propionate/3-hydroxycinnamic acid hydroxylase [Podospora appendiculata]|uniref:3-propionate/3-hydroxycinnamic acid hydroxylase n=1 Tax=Podospora appendiculata TaxID=314037 RepID=A0AAE0XDX5_9PEZI|nr:putative 3-propionate/3-hydroxycinnamic acid hydroxylase [Podospora appendiculata]
MPIQVIIAGAGPAGLPLSFLLAKHGISSLILEAWPALDTRLRATQYGVPATRIFRQAGILDAIRAVSIPASAFGEISWRRIANNHEKLVKLDMSCVAGHEDRMTVIPLGDLVKIMYQKAVDEFEGLVEYLARRPDRLEKILPGYPKADEYRIGETNIYKMHSRCVERMRVGRILLAGDAAHVCNPWGGYGCMSAVLDAGGLAECLVGYYEGKADEDILDKYAEIRREKWIKYVDVRSRKNLDRVSKSDPWTVVESDKFMGILRELEGNEEKRWAFFAGE